MRILHVIHSVNPIGGGPIEGIKITAAAMEKHGVNSEVMSLDAPDTPHAYQFPMPLYLVGNGSAYGYSAEAQRWLLKHGTEYDMVIVNGLWQFGSYAVWRAARHRGFPYCIYTHGMLDPWFKQRYPLKHLKKWLYWPWAEYRALRDASAVLFTSEEERLEARKSFWLYQAKEKVVGYGIAAPSAEGERQKALFLDRFPHLVGKRLILFLGRIHEKKGCELALHAFQKVMGPTAGEPNGYHLVMAGPDNNPYGSRMRELTAQLTLNAAVTWPGMLTGDMKWGALHTADAFILPSHQENFGVAVAEALACGVPVLISNRVNIWREIDGDHAGFTEPDDLPGATRLLDRWMSLSENEKAKMRTSARACFARHFDIETVVGRLLELIPTLNQ